MHVTRAWGGIIFKLLISLLYDKKHISMLLLVHTPSKLTLAACFAWHDKEKYLNPTTIGVKGVKLKSKNKL